MFDNMVVNMKKLYLYFPQWQGSGETNEIYFGANLLKKELIKHIEIEEIGQLMNEKTLSVENNIIGYQRILNNLVSAKNLLSAREPDEVFTLGGDCGVEICPITYLNKHHNSDLLVLWIDAHGDLNTPSSSPSKTFHGMPLRMILGDGDSTLMNYSFSTLEPSQVILVGTRDLDLPEKEYIDQKNITFLEVGSVNFENLVPLIEKSARKKIYIHLDLDVIDSKELPDVKCPTADGLSFTQLEKLIVSLKANYKIVGGSVVEYAAKGNTPDLNVVNLMKKVFSI